MTPSFFSLLTYNTQSWGNLPIIVLYKSDLLCILVLNFWLPSYFRCLVSYWMLNATCIAYACVSISCNQYWQHISINQHWHRHHHGITQYVNWHAILLEEYYRIVNMLYSNTVEYSQYRLLYTIRCCRIFSLRCH